MWPPLDDPTPEAWKIWADWCLDRGSQRGWSSARRVACGLKTRKGLVLIHYNRISYRCWRITPRGKALPKALLRWCFPSRLMSYVPYNEIPDPVEVGTPADWPLLLARDAHGNYAYPGLLRTFYRSVAYDVRLREEDGTWRFYKAGKYLGTLDEF